MDSIDAWTAERSGTSNGPVAMRPLAELFEQVARIVHGACHRDGMGPAQWTALRYFARADENARTVAGLMRFQNMALSPVARTVRLLVERGLLARHPNPRDRRADIIVVTAAGQRVLDRDPVEGLERVLMELPAAESQLLFDTLSTTARNLVSVRRHESGLRPGCEAGAEA